MGEGKGDFVKSGWQSGQCVLKGAWDVESKLHAVQLL